MPAVTFYVSAHPDDWLLFRGEQAFVDLNTPNTRVVFIYTTSGDGGRTDGWWEAREQGAIESIRTAIAPSARFISTSIEKISGHPITTYSCGNSISYCMRLPDGRADGSIRQSMKALCDGLISSSTAVDNSTVYDGWDDFCATIDTIVRQETAASSSSNPWINASDYDVLLSPEDHADHKATGDALRRFAESFCNRAWWVSYDTMNRPANLTDEAYDNKKALFFAYANKVYELKPNNPPMQNEWDWWGNRSYYRLAAFGRPDL